MKVIPKSMNSARACLKQLLHRQKVSHTGWFMGCREAFLQSLFACVLSHNSLIVSFMFSETKLSIFQWVLQSSLILLYFHTFILRVKIAAIFLKNVPLIYLYACLLE